MTTVPTHTIREALLAMAYVEVKTGHWLKPIGYQCFSYHEETNRLETWFTAPNGPEIHLWETKGFKNDPKFGSFLDQLKSFECYTKKDLDRPGSRFELRANDANSV